MLKELALDAVTKRRSDECEKCGSLYDPSELKNPKSKISGETPVLKRNFSLVFSFRKVSRTVSKIC